MLQNPLTPDCAIPPKEKQTRSAETMDSSDYYKELYSEFPQTREAQCWNRTYYSPTNDPENIYCKNCYDKSLHESDVQVIRLHTLTYGGFRPAECMLCLKLIAETRDVGQCEDCFNAYIRLYNDFRRRGYNTNSIISFIYDIDDDIMLQISASTPEFRRLFPEVFSFEP